MNHIEIKFIPVGKEFFTKNVEKHTSVWSLIVITNQSEYIEVRSLETSQSVIVSNQTIYPHKKAAETRDATWTESLVYQKTKVKTIPLNQIISMREVDDGSYFQAIITEIRILVEEEKVYVSYIAKSLVSSRTWFVNPEDILY